MGSKGIVPVLKTICHANSVLHFSNSRTWRGFAFWPAAVRILELSASPWSQHHETCGPD